MPGAPAAREVDRKRVVIGEVIDEGEPIRAFRVRRGAAVTVVGTHFSVGDCCAGLTGEGDPGCSARTEKAEPLRPAADVVLTLRQGGISWRLGSADASRALDGPYEVRWDDVMVPAQAKPGPAVLVAETPEGLQTVLGARIAR